ncbi:subtilase family protein [Antricoccus suffuscus]|uniref:Subtilase family protein n=1 Tax=Antricoccus suffuscus TaxID=1629062 RepID=A0A2T0ZZI4_9ACTN|nr:S8 family serine peptidase [Antricoccus suffuscus]PRZ41763.1 subtilase family protein [Antricoccus suffuscus]
MQLMRLQRISCAVVAALIMLAGSVTLGSRAAADPATGCKQSPDPNAAITDPSWPLTQYDLPDKVWPFTTGNGITVAVLDSGVDRSYPELAKNLLPGMDMVTGQPQGNVDCTGHGTGVASVIAAQRGDGIGTYGIAPGTKILPVRTSETLQADQSGAPEPSGARVAGGINYAVSQGAQVILVSTPTLENSPELEASVAQAIGAGVVVVSAVGDQHPDKLRPNEATPPKFTPYPAAYDGVIGVGAVNADGTRLKTSQIGSYVDVVAPGADVIAGGIIGQNSYSDTSVASAFVAGTAALMLAEPGNRYAAMSGAEKSKAVADTIIGTASPMISKNTNAGYGAGIVDPYRTVTETMAQTSPQALPAHVGPPYNAAAVAAEARAQRSATNSAIIGWASVLVVALAGIGIFVWKRSRRTGWRSGRADTTELTRPEAAPEFVSGEALFAPPPEL